MHTAHNVAKLVCVASSHRSNWLATVYHASLGRLVVPSASNGQDHIWTGSLSSGMHATCPNHPDCLNLTNKRRKVTPTCCTDLCLVVRGENSYVALAESHKETSSISSRQSLCLSRAGFKIKSHKHTAKLTAPCSRKRSPW